MKYVHEDYTSEIPGITATDFVTKTFFKFAKFIKP